MKKGNQTKAKKALGRGLDALIPKFSSDKDNAQAFFKCPIDQISPNRYQPRQKFKTSELAELSASIKSQGVLQPLLVRKTPNGYELVAGERRFRAAKLAGLHDIPVMVKDLTDHEVLEMAIVENVQREDLNPLEEAKAYQQLIDEFGFTQEKVAARVGKSRPAVANTLRLLQLPHVVKEGILDSELSMGHARALLGVDESAKQIAVFRTVLAKGLSVRQTEALIKKMKRALKKSSRKIPTTDDNYFQSLEEDLSREYGTKVNINRRGKKGKLVIEFYSNDDLDRLISLLKSHRSSD